MQTSRSGRLARIPAAHGPTARRLGQRRLVRGPGGRGKAKWLTWKPSVCRSVPRDAYSVPGARPLPGAPASPRRAGGQGSLLCPSKWFVAGPRAAGSRAAGAADLRGRGAGRRGCPGAAAGAARRCRAQGSPPARRGARRASSCTATTSVRRRPSRRAVRGVQPKKARFPGRAPLFRSPTRSITPG